MAKPRQTDDDLDAQYGRLWEAYEQTLRAADRSDTSRMASLIHTGTMLLAYWGRATCGGAFSSRMARFRAQAS